MCRIGDREDEDDWLNRPQPRRRDPSRVTSSRTPQPLRVREQKISTADPDTDTPQVRLSDSPGRVSSGDPRVWNISDHLPGRRQAGGPSSVSGASGLRSWGRYVVPAQSTIACLAHAHDDAASSVRADLLHVDRVPQRFEHRTRRGRDLLATDDQRQESLLLTGTRAKLHILDIDVRMAQRGCDL